jgi:hypothetical protein
MPPLSVWKRISGVKSMVNASFAGAIRHAVHLVGTSGYNRVSIFYYAELGEYHIFGESEVVPILGGDKEMVGVKLLNLSANEFRVLIQSLKTLQVELFSDGNNKKS